jgi:uncharacterized protein (TIGR03435 family)
MVLLAASGALHAQASAPAPFDARADWPAFAVASIRETDTLPQGIVNAGPDRFVQPYINLTDLIAFAYDLTPVQVMGGPSWRESRWFDVSATADGPVPQERVRPMVRRLLAERFGLRAHLETREMEIYALVLARSDGRLGDGLQPSTMDCPAILAARGPDDQPPAGPPQAGEPPRCRSVGMIVGGTMTMLIEGMPMAQFASRLQLMAERIVVDRTGLLGTYDIEFKAERPHLPWLVVPPGQPTTPPEGLSLFTALEEQLGLRLESERAPVEILVIDGATAPTAN